MSLRHERRKQQALDGKEQSKLGTQLGPAINFTQYRQIKGLALLEFQAAVFRIRLLCQEIDLRAEDCPIGKLPEKLAGLDEKLGAAFISFQSAVRGVSLESDIVRILAAPISGRIEGIQRAIREQDGGYYLRAVIAATTPSFSVDLDAFEDKTRPGRPRGSNGQHLPNAVLGHLADRLKEEHPGESWQGLARLVMGELEKATDNTPEWEAAHLLKSKIYKGQGNYLKTQWQRYSKKKSSQ